MGVRHTETSLIIWSAAQPAAEAGAAEPTAVMSTPVEAPAGAVTTPATIQPASLFDADQFYDAGDLGCAYGPLDTIAKTMRGMASGETMEIRATDPTVAIDLSAWCRMTGHTLVEQRDDRYLVRRK